MEEQQLKQCKIKYYQFSEIGKRKTNEDRVSAIKINDESSLFLVADGMGGYNFGNIAAELILDELNKQISAGIGKSTDGEVITNAISGANETIANLVFEKGAQSGATLGGILFHNEHCSLFWVGDVRIVVYRNGELLFKSRSHTLENELKVDIARKTDYINSSVSHIVTRSVCGKEKLYFPDIEYFALHSGDQIMIASDGFYELFNDNEFARSIEVKGEWDDFIQNILHERLEKAIDNASGILIKVI